MSIQLLAIMTRTVMVVAEAAGYSGIIKCDKDMGTMSVKQCGRPRLKSNASKTDKYSGMLIIRDANFPRNHINCVFCTKYSLLRFIYNPGDNF